MRCLATFAVFVSFASAVPAADEPAPLKKGEKIVFFGD